MEAGKKRLQALHTREAILEAATQCFAEKGYSGSNLDAIARRAGLTKGGIYTHFASKAALFIAIIGRAYDRARTKADALAASGLPWVEAIIAHLLECIRNPQFPLDHHLWAEILAVANREPEVRAVFAQYEAQGRENIKKWLVLGMEAGELDPALDVEGASGLLVVMAQGAIVRLTDMDGLDVDTHIRFFEKAVRTILKVKG